MPRIIVFLLTIAALAILALQNLATEVPLVILGKTFADAMPLGLLLLVTVGIGALLTLIFHGLVGSRRPPESKYRPMGRRVPYPEGPGSSNPLPATGSSSDSSLGDYSAGYSSSSAFVSEPKSEPKNIPRPDPKPFVTPPQDRPVKDTPPSAGPATTGTSSPPPFSNPSSSAQDYLAEPPSTYYRPNAGASSSSQDSTRDDSARNDSFRDNSVRDDTRTASEAASTYVQQPIAGLKSVFGKKKDRKDDSEVSGKASERPIGDDWGQRRTKEQINSWDTSVGEPSQLEEGAKRLFNFGRNVGTNAGRLAEDIASGWNNQPEGDRAGSRGDDRHAQEYGDARYDGLDQGWESFDDYGDPPPGERYDKRTYGDSLYGNDGGLGDGYASEPYASEPYASEPYADDVVGPDGVYDADYKVIVPPSKPLPDTDDDNPIDDRPNDYAQ